MRHMKESDIEWIGDLPENWRVVRIKWLLTECNERSENGKEEPLSMSQKYGIIPTREMDIVPNMASSFIGAKLVCVGDLVFNKLKAHLGVFAVSAFEGLVSPDYAVYRSTGKAHLKFLEYMFKTPQCISEFKKKSTGVGAGLTRLYTDGLYSISIPLPPLEEQKRISDYVEHKCRLIDNITENTKSSIEEYKKLRQSIITQAITKGVRGNRPMKDSGIDWFGDIPADWEISRIGLHFDIILGKMLCPNQISEDYTLEPYYCATNVHFDGLTTDTIKEMWFSQEEKEQYAIQKGDLLVVEGGAGAGGCAIVLEANRQMFIQNSIMIVRPRKRNSNVYLRYLIEYLVKQGYIDVVCNKATIPHFTKDKLANAPFILNEEQQEIASYLDQKCTEIDKLISKKEVFLTELENFKKSLICEYVTGKRRLRA